MSFLTRRPLPATTFRRLLQRKGYGIPQFIPEPADNLPPAYKKRGVSIGDVGILTPEGFDFLFNICAPADDLVNANGTPQNFQHIVLQQRDLLVTQNICPPGTIIKTQSIQVLKAQVGAGVSDNFTSISGCVEYKLTCIKSEGAIIALPQGGMRMELRNIKKFKEAASINGKDWYEFANGPLGRNVPIHSLGLVTKCVKASCWALAVFSNSSISNQMLLKLVVPQAGDIHIGFQYSCSTDNPETVRIGPYPASGFVPWQELQNQCIFMDTIPIPSKGNKLSPLFARFIVHIRNLLPNNFL